MSRFRLLCLLGPLLLRPAGKFFLQDDSLGILFYNYPINPSRLQASVNEQNSELTSQVPTKLPSHIFEWCSPLTLMNGVPLGPQTNDYAKYNEVRGMTALVSYPGSGNTWMRYLLQQSTGILTGSVYKDGKLKRNDFPAEGIVNTSVIVVKTHQYRPHILVMYDTAILLVRNPKSAIVAEFNRQSSDLDHVGMASVEKFRSETWRSFVMKELLRWEETNLAWAKDFTGRLKIVYYEDLLTNLELTLREILIFLGQDVNEDRLKCALAHKEGVFKRPKAAFDHYTKDLHGIISERMRVVYAELERYK